MKISILLRMCFLMLIICCSCANNILHIHKESEGLIAIELKDGRIGFKDKQGKLVIPYNFYKPSPLWVKKSPKNYDGPENYDVVFKDGIVLLANKDKLQGFIDKSGKWVIEPRFTYARSFYNGLCLVNYMENGAKIRGYINLKGEVVDLLGVFPENRSYYFYSNEKYGIFQDKESGKWGIFNHKGQITVKPIYDNIDNISEGRAYAEINDIYKLIDMNGNIIFDFKDGGYGRHFINGTSIIWTGIDNKTAYSIIDYSGNHLFPFRTDIDLDFDTPCDTKYLPTENNDCPLYMFHPVIDGVVDAKSTKNNLYGLLNTKGEWVVEPIYESLHYEKDKLYYFMTKDKKKGLMNTKGEIVEWYK